MQNDFAFPTSIEKYETQNNRMHIFPTSPRGGGGEHPGKLLNSYHSQFVHRKFIICRMKEKNCKDDKQYTKSKSAFITMNDPTKASQI